MFEDMNYRAMAETQANIDRLEHETANVFAVAPPPRLQRPLAPRIHVNNVTVQGDNHGVINTGDISGHLSIINNHNQELALALHQLGQAIVDSHELDRVQKQDAIDLLNEVTHDVSKPTAQRRSRVSMKAIGTALGQALSHAANLAKLWSVIEPHIHNSGVSG